MLDLSLSQLKVASRLSTEIQWGQTFQVFENDQYMFETAWTGFDVKEVAVDQTKLYANMNTHLQLCRGLFCLE